MKSLKPDCWEYMKCGREPGGSKSPQIYYLCGYSICEPETGQLEFKDEDLLILTADGLHKKVPVETTVFLIRTIASLEIKAKSLIQAAAHSSCNISP